MFAINEMKFQRFIRQERVLGEEGMMTISVSTPLSAVIR